MSFENENPTGEQQYADSQPRYFFNRLWQMSRLGDIRWGRMSVISVPYFWLALFFFIPFLVVFKISLAETAIAVPPYTDLLELNWEEGFLNLHINLGNYLHGQVVHHHQTERRRCPLAVPVR